MIINNFNLRTSEAHFAKKYGWRGTLTSSDTLAAAAAGGLLLLVDDLDPLLSEGRGAIVGVEEVEEGEGDGHPGWCCQSETRSGLEVARPSSSLRHRRSWKRFSFSF